MSLIFAFLKPFVDPWYKSLENPSEAQNQVSSILIGSYAKTEYGRKYKADQITTLEDFRSSFPVVRYGELKPHLEKAMTGDYSALLSEPVVRWVMTRGTTGAPKLIPTTRTHLSQILSVGSRAIINFALRKKNLRLLEGHVLNLNFPSEVRTLETPSGMEVCGYSSGTYAKLNPALGSARLVPKQEEIDALGGGITKDDWNARFELVYQRSKDEEVKSVMGVAPVILAFARYLKSKHHVAPRNLWNMEALFPTSVARIQTSYAGPLQSLYGNAPIVEMYTATEGVFAQQLDDNPYVCPNYDAYLFEVRTRKGAKLLHELKAGEWGSLVISSTLFPRYEIGDLVESVGKGYFRIIGRNNWRIVLEHALFNIASLRF